MLPCTDMGMHQNCLKPSAWAVYPGGKPDRALGWVGCVHGGWGESNAGLRAHWTLVLGVERWR